MIDQVTITVDRADLDRVLDEALKGVVHPVAVFEAAARIRAAIPEPPWEPSDDTLKAAVVALRNQEPTATWTMTYDILRALHDAGFDLTLREG